MSDSNQLAEVVAMIAERDDDFDPLNKAAICADDESGEQYWSLSWLKAYLGYEEDERIDPAVNRAKIAASKVGFKIKDHFFSVEVYEGDTEVYLTKYACLMVAINADPNKEMVALAQAYFALYADKQRLEDEKRLRVRLDVATENRHLSKVAADRGVENFEKFNGMGLYALYGQKNQAQVREMKGLRSSADILDHAGGEELAADLFRITQTAAVLRRENYKSEDLATDTHVRVADGIRRAIINAGNTPPERLPAATKINLVAAATKKRLQKGQ